MQKQNQNDQLFINQKKWSSDPTFEKFRQLTLSKKVNDELDKETDNDSTIELLTKEVANLKLKLSEAEKELSIVKDKLEKTEKEKSRVESELRSAKRRIK